MSQSLVMTALGVALLCTAGLANAQACTQTRAVNGAFVETSTGPYAPGDTFEATLLLSSSVANEDMGVSTMVLDYNDAAMTYAATPTNGVDYEWLLYQGFPRPTIDGQSAAYNSDVRVTNASRLTAFVELQFTTSTAGRGEAVPTTLTPVLRMRWTVVDATEGIVVTPRSQQFFNGPGGPTGCYATGAWEGLEVGQQTLTGVAGWRMLSAPAGGLTMDSLAERNHLQGVPGYSPTAAANLYAGYSGSAYTTPTAADAELAPGLGLIWYLYDAGDFPSTPPDAFQALPFTLRYAGPAAASFSPGGSIGLDAATLPLHTNGTLFNLVGNPFATSLDVTQLTPLGGAFGSSVVQVWDPGPAAGTGSYLLSTTQGDRVAGWQGFFLENASATAAEVPAAARTTGATIVTRDGPSLEAEAEAARPARHVVPFTLDGALADGTPLLDRAIVLVTDPAALPGWDLLDATKLTPLASAYATLAFTGMRDGGAVLKAQASYPITEEGFVVPLALDLAGGDAALTLRWDPATLPGDVPVTMRDVLTGEEIDLRTASSYAFTAAATQAARAPLTPGTALGHEAAQERFLLAVGQVLPVASRGGAGVEVLALDAPTPNPFQQRTLVRYALPETAEVRVAVYDVLGRQVAVLAEGEKAPGRYEATLDASDLASGVYVIRLVTGETALVRRVTVVR